MLAELKAGKQTRQRRFAGAILTIDNIEAAKGGEDRARPHNHQKRRSF
jgi:hypothetical protein